MRLAALGKQGVVDGSGVCKVRVGGAQTTFHHVEGMRYGFVLQTSHGVGQGGPE